MVWWAAWQLTAASITTYRGSAMIKGLLSFYLSYKGGNESYLSFSEDRQPPTPRCHCQRLVDTINLSRSSRRHFPSTHHSRVMLQQLWPF